MAKYAIIENGIVTNITIWDGRSDWQPPEKSQAAMLTADDKISVGYLFIDGAFTPPAAPIVDTEVFNAAQKEARNVAYRDEADPLYFKWQAGESTESDWRDKRAEIKARFPYIDDAVKV